MRTLLLPALGLFCLLAAAACAVDAGLTRPPTVYVDEWVERPSHPDFYISPANLPLTPRTALFIPFAMRQPMDNRPYLEQELSRAFWRVWLAEQVSPALVFDEGGSWKGPEDAAARARAKGADLAVGGEITYAMFGGTMGETAISVRIQVVDAAGGQPLWSMAHAGSMKPIRSSDYILFTRRSRMPSDPVHLIMTALAKDTAEPVREWNWAKTRYRQEHPEEQPASPLAEAERALPAD
jgi:hypothetical protein